MTSTHRGSFAAGGWLWYVGGLVLISGVLGLAQGTGLMGVVSLLIGAGLLVMPVLRWKQTLVLDDEGLTWTRLTGVTKVSRAQLKQVTLIHHRGRNGNFEELEVVLADGGTLSIIGVEQAEQAASTLHALSTPSTQRASTGWKAP